MISGTLGRYKILRTLGSGAMGGALCGRGHDTRPQRDAQGLAAGNTPGNSGRDGFLRQAREIQVGHCTITSERDGD